MRSMSHRGALYGANTEVSRLETEIRYVSETRQRLESQLSQLGAQREAAAKQEGELRNAANMWQARLLQARERAAGARSVSATRMHGARKRSRPIAMRMRG